MYTSTTTRSNHDLRLVETRNYDLSRKAGEFYVLLQQHAPDVAESVTPIADFPRKFNVISGAIGAINKPNPDPDDLETIHASNTLLADYWQEAAREKERRKWAMELRNIKKHYSQGKITAQTAMQRYQQLAQEASEGHQRHLKETNLHIENAS